MGKHFGNLLRLKGVTYYCMSPNEIRTFAGLLSPGLGNTARRISESVFPMWTAAISGYLLCKFTYEAYLKNQRKVLDDYKDEE